MKQNITIEQYEENKDVRRKLEDIVLLKAEQVTIGKMIEIILENKPKLEMFQEDLAWDDTLKNIVWVIDTGTYTRGTELCDALWETVMEVLK